MPIAASFANRLFSNRARRKISPAVSMTIDYLVVAGGGAGGGRAAPAGGNPPCGNVDAPASGIPSSGGGGAGGVRQGSGISIFRGVPYTVSVGSGGSGCSNPIGIPFGQGNDGTSSSLQYGSPVLSMTATGGGGGGTNGPVDCGPAYPTSGNLPGRSGGSGGGAGSQDGGVPGPGGGGGNAGGYTPSEGNSGGKGSNSGPTTSFGGCGGGGGGAGAVGEKGKGPYDPGMTIGPPSTLYSAAGGAGGTGISSSISGTPQTYAGGGGGGAAYNANPPGGTNGGPVGSPGGAGNAGSASPVQNSGGGGGGGGGAGNASGTFCNAGSSGVVIISYSSAFDPLNVTGSPTFIDNGTKKIYIFNGAGSFYFPTEAEVNSFS